VVGLIGSLVGDAMVKYWASYWASRNMELVSLALDSACERFDGGRSGTFHEDIFRESLGIHLYKSLLDLSDEMLSCVYEELVRRGDIVFQKDKYWKVVCKKNGPRV
jgi:hypothetical protein